MIKFDDIREGKKDYSITLSEAQLIASLLINDIAKKDIGVKAIQIKMEIDLYNLFELDEKSKITVNRAKQIIRENKCKCGENAIIEGLYGNRYCFYCSDKKEKIIHLNNGEDMDLKTLNRLFDERNCGICTNSEDEKICSGQKPLCDASKKLNGFKFCGIKSIK